MGILAPQGTHFGHLTLDFCLHMVLLVFVCMCMHVCTHMYTPMCIWISSSPTRTPVTESGVKSCYHLHPAFSPAVWAPGSLLRCQDEPHPQCLRPLAGPSRGGMAAVCPSQAWPAPLSASSLLDPALWGAQGHLLKVQVPLPRKMTWREARLFYHMEQRRLARVRSHLRMMPAQPRSVDNMRDLK